MLCCVTKVTVTLVLEAMLTVQVLAVCVLHPLHPETTMPESGQAVRVTDVFEGNAKEQLDRHDIPCGVLVTPPDPPPAKMTCKVEL